MILTAEEPAHNMSNDSPKTEFSGTTKEEKAKEKLNDALSQAALIVALAILFPILAIVYLTWIGLTKFARMPYWIPLAFAGLVLVSGLPFGAFSLSGLTFFFSGYQSWLSSDGFPFGSFIESIPGILLGQAYFGVLLGSLSAGLIAGWRWMRRPKYEEVFIKPGAILKKRAKATAKEISLGVNSPATGVTLGVACDTRDGRFSGGNPGEVFGRRVIASDNELSGHTFIVGGSGSGKTQTMLSTSRDVIRQGRGLIFIDCKGGTDVPEKLAEWAARYDRKFLHWTIQDPSRTYTGPAELGPAYYDPISRGDASRRKDLLIGSMRWDIEYYKSVISNYMQTLFKVIDLVPALEGVDTFTDVSDLLDPKVLRYRARVIHANKHVEIAAEIESMQDIESTEKSGIRNMHARLNTIISSVAGHWLKKDPTGQQNIDLMKAADEGQVVVFSLDTSQYEETASLIAGLIVQDLKTLSSELRYGKSDLPLHIYIDEFSAVDTTNVLGLLSKARDAQMPCTLATQALADLARREPTFMEQVLGIVSSFIIHRTNAKADAEVYAGLSGIVSKTVARRNIEDNSSSFGLGSSSTGKGFLEEKEDYAVKIGTFQRLGTGEAVYIAKSPTMRYVNFVKVIPENPNVLDNQRDKGIPRIGKERPLNERVQKETYPHPAIARQLLKEAQAPINEATRNVSDRLVSSTGVVPKRPVEPIVEETTEPTDPTENPQSLEKNVVIKKAGEPIPNVVARTIKPKREKDIDMDDWSGIP
jgi:hypothetical protein